MQLCPATPATFARFNGFPQLGAMRTGNHAQACRGFHDGSSLTAFSIDRPAPASFAGTTLSSLSSLLLSSDMCHIHCGSNESTDATSKARPPNAQSDTPGTTVAMLVI